ncbi:MAG: pyrroline-5-carboxylate reductase [Burkholderiales bacterium]
MTITFIGGGNMASALIGGLKKKGFDAAGIRVVDPSPEARAHVETKYQVTTFATLEKKLVDSDVVLLAVKPQQMHEVAQVLAGLLECQLVISIAAGIRSADLSRWLGDYPLLVRVMPNTPALVSAGISALYAMPGVTRPQREQAETILGAVGKTLWLTDEMQMDGVTAISGSGPAYVFYFIEALEQAATELGFDAEQARLLSIETFLGASRLASESEEHVATLRARVTSKGGTTETALRVMENHEVKKHIVEATHAATERAQELGEMLGKPG